MSLTVAGLLAQARAIGVDRLDAHRLIGWVMSRPREWLMAHDDALVEPQQAARIRELMSRRAQGAPLAYLVGEREFRGLTFKVTRDVLVPRPETELLVDWALERLQGRTLARVLDLGTGSGAIAIAVKVACPHAQVVAVDKHEPALAVARDNAQRLGAEIEFLQGDWFDGWSRPPFDLVLCNPPYIDAGDKHLLALHQEPLHALSPGPDGMSDLRHLAGVAMRFLVPAGWIILEHGHLQGPPVRKALEGAGWREVQTRPDLAGWPRCTAGRKP